MDIEKPLLETAHANCLIQGFFYLHNLHTKLTVYSDSIHFSNQKAQCSYVITFDFSYEIVKQQSGWFLILQIPEDFKFFSNIDLSSWDHELIKVMKRKSFHQFYHGVKKIGKGNFASVYLSQKLSDGTLYAVKAFQKKSAFQPTNGKQGLQNEINILRKLNHPNITHLQGVYQTQNSIYLVMELIEGKSLGQILDQQKSLSLKKRKKIIQGILAGLAQMQQKDIVHRDIKPENVMINTLGQAKIVDFGLATNTKASNYLYVRCGTPGFVAPEIINIKDTQEAKMSSISDVFSAGAIFYHMVFGKPLFQGDKNGQILQKNRRCLVMIPTSSELANYEQLFLLRRMLDVCPNTRITACQALGSSYFAQKLREPFKQITEGQQSNKRMHSLKSPSSRQSRNKKTNDMQKQN